MKKRVVAVLMTVVMAMGMVACGGGKDSKKESKSADGKIEIDFYEHSDAEPYIQDLVDAYEKQNPNVKVNLTKECRWKN